MSERYATIITDDDGNEIVSNIMQYEGKPQAPRSPNARIIKIGDGVKIGMVKGGTVEPSGGYGFPAGSEPALGKTEAPKKVAPKKPDDSKGESA